MRVSRQFLVWALSFGAAFFLFSGAAKAQQVPDYLFLEVLDSKGRPVDAAEVRTRKSDFNSTDRKRYTDEKGTFKFFLPWSSHYENLDSYFTVIKDGFFIYHDLGGSGGRSESKARIELLKIPQTTAEKRALADEQRKREFMWAAKTGDPETIRKLLKEGISPNLTTTDLRGVSGRKDVPAIQFAALSADSETIEVFIKAGVNIRSKTGPLHGVLIMYLLADPFYWHQPATEEERKVMLRRYENGVDILLKAGADFNVLENNYRPPIMIAAEKGYLRAVKLLLGKGISVNSKDTRGRTLLSYAAEGDYENKISKIETVNFLLQSGADPNEDCGSALSTASSRGDVEVIRALLKSGAKINPECGSPLWNAVLRGKTKAVEFLIESGADFNYTANYGENILMLAAKNNNAEMIQLLIDKGFPLNKASANGATALFAAVENSYFSELETMKILLNSGADPNIIVSYDKSTCSTPLIHSVGRQNFNAIKLLIENKADINLDCGRGETALVYAIRRHQPEIVKQLIELGADVNGEPIDKTMSLIKTFYKEGDYYRKFVDETIKIIEEARAQEKSPNN